MTQLAKRLWSRSDGQNLSEYALLLLLVSLVAVAGMGGLASRVDHAYLKASTRLTTAGSTESITTDPIDDDDSIQINHAVTTNRARPALNDREVYGRSRHLDTLSR